MIVITLAIILLLYVQLVESKPFDRTTVEALDVERYMGTWHEIARFDHSFECDLVDVTATYTLLDDGMIEVVNRGFNTITGEWKSTTGRAKRGRKAGQLKVSFFWRFYAQYNVLALGEDYSWALVGSRSPRYLWILARESTLPKQKLDKILKFALNRGYDVDKLINARNGERLIRNE